MIIMDTFLNALIDSMKVMILSLWEIISLSNGVFQYFLAFAALLFNFVWILMKKNGRHFTRHLYFVSVSSVMYIMVTFTMETIINSEMNMFGPSTSCKIMKMGQTVILLMVFISVINISLLICTPEDDRKDLKTFIRNTEALLGGMSFPQALLYSADEKSKCIIPYHKFEEGEALLHSSEDLFFYLKILGYLSPFFTLVVSHLYLFFMIRSHRISRGDIQGLNNNVNAYVDSVIFVWNALMMLSLISISLPACMYMLQEFCSALMNFGLILAAFSPFLLCEIITVIAQEADAT